MRGRLLRRLTTGSPPVPRPHRRLGGAQRVVAAGLSGVVLALAFPPYDVWPLALPAVLALTLLTRGSSPRHGAALGLAHGLGFYLPLLAWVRVIGVDAWLLLVLLESLFASALGAGLALVGRLRAWPVWAAALWVAQEAARARAPFGGFPWGRIAFGVTDSPFVRFAALGGAPLVTFATVLCAGLLALACVNRRGRAGWALAAAAAVPISAYLPSTPADGRPVTVALVQGNVARSGLDFLGEREQVLRNHVAATEGLAQRVRSGEVKAPDLVVWPENSSDVDPFADPDARALIDGAVRAVGVPTLVGTLIAGPGPRYVSNTGVVWDPVSGPGQRYVKRHPVPFGEYIPLRDLVAGWIERLDRIPRDFFAGDRPGVLDVGPARAGDVICFEVAYDPIVRDVVRGGADVLVVQTNNATYNGTGQPQQQAAMARLRALEHGRAVLVASTSGISLVVTPDGKVLARTAELTPAVVVRTVGLRRERTVASRVGAAPEGALSLAGLLAAGRVLAGPGRRVA